MNLFQAAKIFAGVSFALLGCVSTPIAQAELQTVPSVDLPRYLGDWYEVASIPQSFQKQCVGDTRAQYSGAEDNAIKVINSCATEDGSVSSAEGRVRVVDATSNAKLRVTFVNLLGRWIYLFGGDYWIIDLGLDYEYAVVGHPDLAYGWILSRTPELDREVLGKIGGKLVSSGYDLCKFNVTRQAGGFDGPSTRLCDYLRP